jgi:hypothetical protein
MNFAYLQGNYQMSIGPFYHRTILMLHHHTATLLVNVELPRFYMMASLTFVQNKQMRKSIGCAENSEVKTVKDE